MSYHGRRIDIRGIVQGVGMRPWVYRLARERNLTGRVWNHPHGVTIDVYGPEGAIEAFLHALRAWPPPAARLDAVTESPLSGPPPEDFRIIASAQAPAGQPSIPPDLALCTECVAEIQDPAARRYRYAFTNCTNCGPRFTIAQDVPYDRSTTTMRAFVMCEACRAEYEDPADRRFHAQPIACPACGPRLRLVDGAGRDLAHGDVIEAAAARLRAGAILAVKGLGGYLLACDATSPRVVRTLRQRKRREEKPFAVMVSTLADAEQLAWLTDAERTLLQSPAAPIVLCRARDVGRLAPEIAPRSPLVGLFLAYTPLHRLLCDAARTPLVMTSGNVSDEPLAFRDDEALERLAGLADAWLTHDRGIAAPCDDSVARVMAGGPVILRRARGYVPRPVRLPRPVPRPVLACGALLKNTFCLAAGELAWLGPHIGDLDNLLTTTHFERSIERLERFTRIVPEAFAHDLHPDLHSTLYATQRGGAAAVAVQHHHAHVAAVMAEHRIEGPVIGLAYDGTGHGPDGASWGGEVLVCTAEAFSREVTFRPLALAGGDRAAIEVWRLALALLRDAYGTEAPTDRFPAIADRPAAQRRLVDQLLATGLQVVAAHGVGRYFDAFGALALGCQRSAYEGQVAIEWNHAAADPWTWPPYPYDLDTSATPARIDLRATTRAVVDALLGGVPVPEVSARFHRTLIAASGEAVRLVARRHGRLPVVLGGGCFQNPLLTEGLLRELGPGFTVWCPREVPPGDGGLSLGQVLVAAAITR